MKPILLRSLRALFAFLESPLAVGLLLLLLVAAALQGCAT